MGTALKTSRKLVVLGTTALTGVLVAGAAAWACVAGPTLLATPQVVGAGETVAISGISYNADLPVVVRFDALDGPVLGTFPVNQDTDALAGSVQIPADATPGNHVLVATQSSEDGDVAIIPTRALVSVAGPGGAPVLGAPLGESDANRPVGLVEAGSASTQALVLAGAGAAGVALFLAGAAVYFSTRRQPTPEKARP
ncbi:MAG: hypothetical protein KY451_04880 [Actinobacteria bacterium]|nr:hypothetical protein [Actinomycetota bacterium]MBW3646529.1 hypothetical protein [Actinomycetota bacterium]